MVAPNFELRLLVTFPAKNRKNKIKHIKKLENKKKTKMFTKWIAVARKSFLTSVFASFFQPRLMVTSISSKPIFFDKLWKSVLFIFSYFFFDFLVCLGSLAGIMLLPSGGAPDPLGGIQEQWCGAQSLFLESVFSYFDVCAKPFPYSTF